MQSNKLRMAIRSTAAVAILGVAAQAQAFDFSAGDVDASIYGYARLNATYDMNADISDNSESGTFSSITDTDEEGDFGFSAAQSRIGVTATNSDGVKFNIEGDFFAAGDNFRLRHAYGEYKGVLAGQTWSNYNSFVGNTSILDFNAVPGTAGFQLRSAQVRYTTGPISVSVEERKSFNAGVLNGGEMRESMPAFTARMEDSAGGISYSVAALATQVTHDNSDDVGGDDDSSLAFAVFGAAKLAVTDMVSVQGALNYSDGANTYLYQSGAPDGYLDGDGNLETISGIGASLGTGISLGGGRSINLGYGMTKVDFDDAEDDGIAVGDQAETNQNVFLNYQWTPVANTMMGVEYSYWDTESQAGDSADASRIMFAAQYNF